MLNVDRGLDRFAPPWLVALLLAVNYAAVSVLVYIEYAAYPDHSPSAMAYWLFLYFVAIVQPIIFEVRIARQLRDSGLTRRQRNFCAFAPGIVGGVTLLFALHLIGGP